MCFTKLYKKAHKQESMLRRRILYKEVYSLVGEISKKTMFCICRHNLTSQCIIHMQFRITSILYMYRVAIIIIRPIDFPYKNTSLTLTATCEPW